MSEKIIIELTEPRGFILPPVEETGDYDEAAGKILVPGQNNITKRCWDAVKKNPGVSIALQRGTLKKVGVGNAMPLATDFAAMKLPRLVEIINKLKDIDSVEKIKAKERRKGAILACDTKIQELMKAQEDESLQDDEE